MGFTNTTAHYSLPQYLATDKPKYLTDFNQTMEAIDTQMYTNAQAAATADGKAVAAKDVADGAVSSIGTLNTQINGDALDPSDRGLAGDVSDNSGAINTINALIGNGTPTTSDKTIIGAINEIYADITGGGTDVTAANVSYDNTTSGLTADDVQEAIDEVYAAIPSVTTPDAEDVSYDNTTSGLVATNVQTAIDELAQNSSYDFQDVVITKTVTGSTTVLTELITTEVNNAAPSGYTPSHAIQVSFSGATTLATAFKASDNSWYVAFISASASSVTLSITMRYVK